MQPVTTQPVIGTEMCRGRDLVESQFMCDTDVCALDSIGLRADDLEPRATCVAPRARGLSIILGDTRRLDCAGM